MPKFNVCVKNVTITEYAVEASSLSEAINNWQSLTASTTRTDSTAEVVSAALASETITPTPVAIRDTAVAASPVKPLPRKHRTPKKKYKTLKTGRKPTRYLKDSEVVDIYKARGVLTQNELAKMYGVCLNTVFRIQHKDKRYGAIIDAALSEAA